jgi:hypothetical protein
MSFLTINGIGCQILADNSAAEPARDYGGALRRAWDGTLRNATRWQKRKWSFTVAPLIASDFAALEAATALRAIVAVDGAGIDGPNNCAVEHQSASYIYSNDPAAPVPTFYSQGVGDATWNILHSTRTPNNFACSDGIMLDLIGDTDVAAYASDWKSCVFVGDGQKLIRYRVARSGVTKCGISLHDDTVPAHVAFFDIDFTNPVPIIGANFAIGTLLSAVLRGDGAYDITLLSVPIIARRNFRVLFYPALPAVADTGQANVGNVSIYDDAAGQLGFRRTLALSLMEK